MVKSTMTGTVTSSGHGGTAAAMSQNEQTSEENVLNIVRTWLQDSSISFVTKCDEELEEILWTIVFLIMIHLSYSVMILAEK